MMILQSSLHVADVVRTDACPPLSSRHVHQTWNWVIGSPGQLGLRVAGFPGHRVAASQNVTQFHV